MSAWNEIEGVIAFDQRLARLGAAVGVHGDIQEGWRGLAFKGPA